MSETVSFLHQGRHNFFFLSAGFGKYCQLFLHQRVTVDGTVSVRRSGHHGAHCASLNIFNSDLYKPEYILADCVHRAQLSTGLLSPVSHPAL